MKQKYVIVVMVLLAMMLSACKDKNGEVVVSESSLTQVEHSALEKAIKDYEDEDFELPEVSDEAFPESSEDVPLTNPWEPLTLPERISSGNDYFGEKTTALYKPSDDTFMYYSEKTVVYPDKGLIFLFSTHLPFKNARPDEADPNPGEFTNGVVYAEYDEVSNTLKVRSGESPVVLQSVRTIETEPEKEMKLRKKIREQGGHLVWEYYTGQFMRLTWDIPNQRVVLENRDGEIFNVLANSERLAMTTVSSEYQTEFARMSAYRQFWEQNPIVNGALLLDGLPGDCRYIVGVNQGLHIAIFESLIAEPLKDKYQGMCVSEEIGILYDEEPPSDYEIDYTW